ncbi:MAG: hypothetical protein ACK5P7_10320 [Bdellovibrio sp.]
MKQTLVIFLLFSISLSANASEKRKPTSTGRYIQLMGACDLTDPGKTKEFLPDLESALTSGFRLVSVVKLDRERSPEGGGQYQANTCSFFLTK